MKSRYTSTSPRYARTSVRLLQLLFIVLIDVSFFSERSQEQSRESVAAADATGLLAIVRIKSRVVFMEVSEFHCLSSGCV